MKLEVEKGVPIPELRKLQTTWLQPVIAKLEPADSFFVPTDKPASIRSLALKCAMRLHITCTTRVRIEDGVKGIRIWRVL